MLQTLQNFASSTEDFLNKTRVFWAITAVVYTLIFSLRLALQSQFDFLFLWDEQFHALVAKNMAEGSMLKPLLYKEIPLQPDYTDWTSNHVWLHKQPLFLWQMALFIKLLGTEPWVIRLPSLLMNLAAAFLYVDLGRILFRSRWIGFWMGLLLLLNPFSIMITAGMTPTDHNDAVFLFYFTLAAWAFVRYWLQKSLSWALLIGFAVAAAALTKWLIGFWIFGVWGLTLLFHPKKLKRMSTWIHFLGSFLFALTLFLPWQFYAAHHFPQEYFYELEYNARHIGEGLEGHVRNTFFYWDNFGKSFGNFPNMKYFVFFGALFWVFKSSKPRQIHLPMVLGFSLFLALFSYSATQMGGYVYPMSFLTYGFTLFILYVAVWWFYAVFEYKLIKWIFIALLINASIAHSDYNRLRRETDFSIADNKLAERKHMAQLAKAVAAERLEGKWVFFNLPIYEGIHFQYFANHLAYSFMPDENMLAELKRQGYRCVLYLSEAEKKLELENLKPYLDEIRKL